MPLTNARTCSGSCRSKAQLPTSCPGKGRRGREAVFSGLWNTGFPWDSFKWCQACSPPHCCCLISSDAHPTVAAESSSVHGLQCRFLCWVLGLQCPLLCSVHGLQCRLLCPVDWAQETVHLNSSLRATEKLIAVGSVHCVPRP